MRGETTSANKDPAWEWSRLRLGAGTNNNGGLFAKRKMTNTPMDTEALENTLLSGFLAGVKGKKGVVGTFLAQPPNPKKKPKLEIREEIWNSAKGYGDKP